jgi:hypothetical protein
MHTCYSIHTRIVKQNRLQLVLLYTAHFTSHITHMYAGCFIRATARMVIYASKEQTHTHLVCTLHVCLALFCGCTRFIILVYGPCAASDVFTQTVDAAPSSSCVDEVEVERLRSAHDDAVQGFELLKEADALVVVVVILMMKVISVVIFDVSCKCERWRRHDTRHLQCVSQQAKWFACNFFASVASNFHYSHRLMVSVQINHETAADPHRNHRQMLAINLRTVRLIISNEIYKIC